MLSAKFLDLLHEVACMMKKLQSCIRWCVQLYLVGDLAQLAPVPELHEVVGRRARDIKKSLPYYAFESRVWQRANSSASG